MSGVDPECAASIDMFDAIAEKIKKLDAIIEQTKKFQASIAKHKDSFTPEEADALSARLAQLTRERDEQTQVLAIKIDLYENKIRSIEQLINTRSSVIETSEGTFVMENDDALMQLFSKRHADLCNELDDARQRLMT